MSVQHAHVERSINLPINVFCLGSTCCFFKRNQSTISAIKLFLYLYWRIGTVAVTRDCCATCSDYCQVVNKTRTQRLSLLFCHCSLWKTQKKFKNKFPFQNIVNNICFCCQYNFVECFLMQNWEWKAFNINYKAS